MTRTLLLLAGAAALSSPTLAQDISLPPTFGSTSLQAGFTPDPFTVDLTAGGSNDAVSVAPQCSGSIANAPDYSITYTPGAFSLYFGVDSNADTTLAINDPDGNWHCNDDASGLDPAVAFENPQGGRYDVYVGTFGGSTAPATLLVSETGVPTGPGASGGDADLTLPAIDGEYALAGGFLPDPWRRSVTAGGPLDAETAADTGCAGSITQAPTVEIDFDGSGPLHIYTAGDADTTLAVNQPNGSWICDDDGGTMFNAGLTSNAGSGIYDIYVGTFGGSQQRVSLLISEIEIGHGEAGK